MRLKCRVESRRRRRCEYNSQLAHDDCRRIRSIVWKRTRLHSGLTTRILIDIDNLFNNDVIMSSLVTNLNSSTAQKIVHWVTTADRCVHTADTMQLDFAVGKSVQTRRDCRQLVACYVHTTVELSRVGGVNAPVGSLDPVYNFLCCYRAIEVGNKRQHNDVIV